MTPFKNTVRPVGLDQGASFSKLTFSEKERLMREATEWLDSQGISYYRTRVGKYLRDIQRLNAAHSQNCVQQLIDEGEFPVLVNSLFESSELISIYEGLHPNADGFLSQKLRDFVKGTEFATAESKSSLSNKGRDIGFELFTASLFSKGGFQLDFSTDADVVASEGGRTFFIECKRPQADHSVRSNVRAAAKQVSQRLIAASSQPDSYGIICLSTEKVVNPERKLLVASTEQDLDSKMSNVSGAFFVQHQADWRSIREQRLLGILMFLQVPGVIENHNMVATCRFLTANNLPTTGKSGYELLLSVVSKLKRGLITQ